MGLVLNYPPPSPRSDPETKGIAQACCIFIKYSCKSLTPLCVCVCVNGLRRYNNIIVTVNIRITVPTKLKLRFRV